MDAFIQYLNHLTNKNKQDYNNQGDINWLNNWRMDKYEETKKNLLDALKYPPLFNQTKPYYNKISKGCEICGSGKWSCLFITGICNANCFYCPAAQNTEEPPQSQGLTFETPEAYAEYINHFGFTGVSFSGGEPLLVADKVIDYLSAVRQMCNPKIYTWLYTNGILGNTNLFKKLAQEGLNEIRFDIGATNYKLDALAKAQNTVPVLTVEIPAVPEEKELIKELLPELEAMGVQNTNLHQLRLTKHNAQKLLKHNYTYIPAERPIVAESEIAALEIIQHAQQTGIKMGINYCSFYFKHRFQKAGFRRIIAEKLIHPQEIITQNGYIRTRNAAFLKYETFSIYDELNPKATIPTQTLDLKHKTYFINRQMHDQITTNNIAPHLVSDLLNKGPETIPTKNNTFKIWQHEYLEKGLR